MDIKPYYPVHSDMNTHVATRHVTTVKENMCGY